MDSNKSEDLTTWLIKNGYYDLRPGPLDKPIGLLNFMFTVGIVVGVDWVGYGYRYCYHTLNEARGALDDWEKKNFEGEPEGYIVRKGLGPDKPGPMG